MQTYALYKLMFKKRDAKELFGEEKARQISSTMYPSHIPNEEHEEHRKKFISELLELTSKGKTTP